MCDFKYFRNLSLQKQQNILEQMKEIQKHSQLTKPYRISLLETDIPSQYKVTAFNKINTLTYMDPGAGEYYKIKQWVDTFMHIPFGKYNTLPLSLKDGQEKCQTFMEDARDQLDNVAYGLNDAKMQIMQMVGQWISNPDSVGTAIAIHGPMGTGKTTLVKEGISKILNRPFAFIALGGATDSSFLEGHSYTYEGSTWGKIVDILIQSKCMNPVIYFDELDKVSDTPKGEEIIGILTHLTDTTQNKQFHDKYFSNLDFDISKALFIFSYNDEKKINPILRDRMYRIETKGYDKKEKTIIASKYLIPVIEKNIKFEENQISIPDETLHYLIDQFTVKEKGVRNLKRCLEIIYSKLNLFRLMKPDSKLFDSKMNSLKVEFPFVVKKEVVDKLINKESADIPYNLYL
jgi:ATP-dependent Lon protease